MADDTRASPGGDSFMILRPATPADIAMLHRWESAAHVAANLGADPSWDWAADIASPAREILIGEADGRPIGFLEILDPARDETGYWGDIGEDLRALDIWLGEAADLGRGLGTRMMRLALDRCFATPTVAAVLVDPLARNADAIRFYERVGFRPVGPRRLGEDDCLVLRCDRDDWVPTGG